jgi:aspartokinase
MSNSKRPASDVVREFIERDGIISNGLARDLINVRALARYIQIATHEEYSFEALVSAIHRFPMKERAAKHQSVSKLMSKLSLKNEIAVVEILNAPEIPASIARFSSEVDYARGETFSAVSGIRRTRVTVDSKSVDKLVSVVPKKNILSITRNLAEVVLEMSEKSILIPGVYATIITELAMNDINIVDPLSCIPEIIFVVDEKDGAKAYQVLERLKKAQN